MDRWREGGRGIILIIDASSYVKSNWIESGYKASVVIKQKL